MLFHSFNIKITLLSRSFEIPGHPVHHDNSNQNQCNFDIFWHGRTPHTLRTGPTLFRVDITSKISQSSQLCGRSDICTADKSGPQHLALTTTLALRSSALAVAIVHVLVEKCLA